MNLWRLPDGVRELRPAEALRVEALRRLLLDHFATCGYSLVSPPLLEFLDSLTTGMDDELYLATLKFVDQESGRLLGVRADLTLQAARMDTHSLPGRGIRRLCYCENTSLSFAPPMGGDRCPVKIGAELYGHAGVESDVEIMLLMASSLRLAGITDLHMDLGHVGIYRVLTGDLGLSAEQKARLNQAMQAKAIPDLAPMIQEFGIAAQTAAWLLSLPGLAGGVEVLDQARRIFAAAPQELRAALELTAQAVEIFRRRCPDVALSLDFSELRGYGYHTGMVFSAYSADQGRPIATGGRYDGIGDPFGHSRPATGFDADLKILAALGTPPRTENRLVCVPWNGPSTEAENQLLSIVDELRLAGFQVIYKLPGESHTAPAGAGHLVWRTERWTLVPPEKIEWLDP